MSKFFLGLPNKKKKMYLCFGHSFANLFVTQTTESCTMHMYTWQESQISFTQKKKMRTRLGTMRIVGLFALNSYCDRKSKRKSHVWNAPKFLISENELILTERLRDDLLMANNTKWFFFLCAQIIPYVMNTWKSKLVEWIITCDNWLDLFAFTFFFQWGLNFGNKPKMRNMKYDI